MSDRTKGGPRHLFHAWTTRCAVALSIVGIASFENALVSAQIKAAGRGPAMPAWSKGILPISAESYWNAVESGKQGGEDPPCVFFDTGLCKNDDYTLALFTPYKMVAYEVWRVVRQKQPAPTPSFQEAQRTRITIGVTLARGSKNPLTSLTLKRDGKTVAPVDRSLGDGGGRFTFDYPAWAPTADVTLDLAGQAKTISCVIEKPVLTLFR